MHDSEDESDYIEILKNVNNNNVILQHQELDLELKTRYENAMKLCDEKRNTLLKLKEDFEMKQLKIMKGNIILSDLRVQCQEQAEILEELDKKSEALDEANLENQKKFDEAVSKYKKEIMGVSADMDEEALLNKILVNRSEKEKLDAALEGYKYKRSTLLSLIEEESKSLNIQEMKEFTQSAMEYIKSNEKNFKKLKDMECDISKYESIIANMQKQLL